MRKIKNIISFGFIVVIFMMHTIFIFHTFEHHSTIKKAKLSIQKETTVSDLSLEKCVLCDLFLNGSFAVITNFSFQFIGLLMLVTILFWCKNYPSAIVGYQKSRAPPFLNVV